MFRICDKHIDFILNDIRARGIELENLQNSLLDHICCIIENKLEENGDFEKFYQKTITAFFKTNLKEIENETISLIIFKHYYTMKKAMIVSGTISAMFLTIGLLFKLLHWPGASISLILGIGLLSILFLPLMFVLKIKEKQQGKDRLIIGIGTLCGILISLGILFKVMHWPGANLVMQGSIAIMLLLFLPLYFFTGIRNPETKVNTIVSSIILFSAIGLLFTLMRTPKGTKIREEQLTQNFLRNEKLLQEELRFWNTDTNSIIKNKKTQELIERVEKLKQRIVYYETNGLNIEDLNNNKAHISDHSFSDTYNNPDIIQQSNELKKMVDNINNAESNAIPYKGMFFDDSDFHYTSNINTLMALDQLIQIQRMAILSNKLLLANK